jgi:hypothetical protein
LGSTLLALLLDVLPLPTFFPFDEVEPLLHREDSGGLGEGVEKSFLFIGVDTSSFLTIVDNLELDLVKAI